MSVNGDFSVLRNGRSTSNVSIYNYPEHLNPFYDDDNHKRLRFWKLNQKDSNSGRRYSFSMGGLKDTWVFKSFRLKKKSSTLGINKTSESPPSLRREIKYNSLDDRSNNYQRSTSLRNSLEAINYSEENSTSFNRNDKYRNTIQNYSFNRPFTSTPLSKRKTNNESLTSSVNELSLSDQCLHHGTSQLSIESTNPFENDDDRNTHTPNCANLSPTKKHRKKRRAPAPPVGVHQSGSVGNYFDDSADLNNTCISNLTAEIQSFVENSKAEDSINKPKPKSDQNFAKSAAENAAQEIEDVHGSQISSNLADNNNQIECIKVKIVKPSFRHNINEPNMVTSFKAPIAKNHNPQYQTQITEITSQAQCENSEPQENRTKSNIIESSNKTINCGTSSFKNTEDDHRCKPQENQISEIFKQTNYTDISNDDAIGNKIECNNNNNKITNELYINENSKLLIAEEDNQCKPHEPLISQEVDEKVNNNAVNEDTTHNSYIDSPKNTFESVNHKLEIIEKEEKGLRPENRCVSNGDNEHKTKATFEVPSKTSVANGKSLLVISENDQRCTRQFDNKESATNDYSVNDTSNNTIGKYPKEHIENNNTNFEIAQIHLHSSKNLKKRSTEDDSNQLKILEPVDSLGTNESFEASNYLKEVLNKRNNNTNTDFPWKSSTLATLRSNVPVENRKSVKDIIESINKSQQLLNIASHRALSSQNDYSFKNGNINNLSLEKSQQETARGTGKVDYDCNLHCIQKQIAPADFNRGTEYKIENHKGFEKNKIEKEVANYREGSPTTSNLDWNPVPKPKRTINQ